MKPLGLTVNKLALDLHVPATRIGEIVHGRRRITVDTALRLGAISAPMRSSGLTSKTSTTWKFRSAQRALLK